ncbi:MULTISPECIES: DUF6239 family natural product biosynthesis protein [unclassified Saccharothrix]|uniref:DUF6239 family natural product biosynthesis protein n=1 Tax=unclassified Saccharothrix TaxID=2593673 RepID=UPI00307DE456
MHGHGGGAVGLPLGFTLLRLVLLAAVTIAAGWALTRPFSTTGPRTRQVVTGAAAAGGVVSLLVADARWLPAPAAAAVLLCLCTPPLLRDRFPGVARCVVAAVVMTATAAVLWFAGPPLAGAHVVLMAGFAGVAWLAVCPPTVMVRAVGIGLGVALLVSLAQITVAGHLVTPPSGRPVLSRVVVGGGPVDVLVVPHRPGWNLVHTAGPLKVGNSPTALVDTEERPGASGRWALVWLGEVRGSLWLERDGVRATMPVDPGKDPWTGPDVRGSEAPEHVSAVLASLLTGNPTDQPWPTLTDSDAATLRTMVAKAQGPIAIVSDRSARSLKAEEVIHAEAARLNIPIDPAASTKIVLTQGHHAPWSRPPDLTTPEAQSYVRALADAFPGEAPTAAGLAAWTTGRAQ